MSARLVIGIDARSAAALLATRRAAERWWSGQGVGVPAEVVQTFDEIESILRRDTPTTSDLLPRVDVSTSAAACSTEWITTSEARDRIRAIGPQKITIRGVVDAVHRGRLVGRQDGEGASWLIDAATVEPYARSRFARLERRKSRDDE